MTDTTINKHYEALTILQTMMSRGAVRNVDAIQGNIQALMAAMDRAEKVSPAALGVTLDLFKMMVGTGAVADYSEAAAHMDRIVDNLGNVASAGKGKAPAAKAALPKAKAAAPQAAPQAGKKLAGAALKSFQRKQELEAQQQTGAPQAAPQAGKKLAGAALKSFQRKQELEAQQQTGAASTAARRPSSKAHAKEAAPPAATARQQHAAPTASEGTEAPRLTAAQEGRLPAVPLKESVQKDFIICLHDGRQMKMLKRHIWNQYGMMPDDYRAYWGLPPDYPMVAPNYAKQKSRYAKSMGLGTVAMREEVAAKRETANVT
jgi:predicted transcriptional regulator